MFYVLQNESDGNLRRVPILLTDAATGTTAQTGVATTNIFPYVNINGGAFAGGAGTVGEAGYGQYYYQMDSTEVGTLGLAGIHITAAGCRDYDAIAQIAAFNVYSAAGGGISAADVWNYTLNGSGQTAEYQLDTAALQSTDVNNRSMTIETQTLNISNQVWSDDLATNAYAAGTAGTILYTLGQAGTSITAGDVWDYVGGRTITGGIADTVTLVTSPVDISYASMAGLANTIWSTNVSGYTSPSAGYDLTQAAVGGAGISAYDVWDFNITGFGGTNSAAVYVTDTNFVAGNIQTYVSTQTPQDVWTYAGIEGRTITGGIADTVTTVSGNVLGSVGSVTADVNVSTASMAGVANTVWSTLTAPYTTHATFGHQVLRSDNAATIGEVTLHQSGGSKRVDADVHAFVNNTASATAMLNILTGIGSSMTTNITGNITGNLSGSVGSVTNPVSVTTASMTGIAGTVWNTDVSAFTSPSAGYDVHNGAGTAISAYDVWNFDPTAMTVPQAGAILTDIQTDTNQIQTDISNIPNNVWVSDVSGYTNPGEAGYELTQAASGAGLTVGDVWSYATRTITGGIADTVTTLTNGVTVTTNNDKTGYSLSGTQSFNLTGNITGSLSGSVGSVTGSVGSVVSAVTLSPATQASIANSVWLTDVTSYAAPSAGEDLATAAVGGISPADVWTYATRTITGGIADTVTTVTNGVTVTTNNDKTGYALSGAGVSAVQSGLSTVTVAQVGQEVDSSLLDVGLTSTVTGRIDATVSSRLPTSSYVTPPTTAAIAGTVWTYGSRTLTSGSGISASDVWNYDISGITTSGSAGNALNDAAVSGSVVTIVNGPYRLNSTAEGTDGRIDILQGSIQTINLNLVNGFDQPFNVTGYSLSVDIYDVSSTLVESYVPTVNFASGGNISFDIDGTVTDVIGTYTLVVSLTDGDVIQVGPITILVRPL
jgi:hypothetical protein